MRVTLTSYINGVPIFSTQREGLNTFLTLRLSCEGQQESYVLVQSVWGFFSFLFSLKESNDAALLNHGRNLSFHTLLRTELVHVHRHLNSKTDKPFLSPSFFFLPNHSCHICLLQRQSPGVRKSVMVCVSPRLCISKCVYVSWGLYVFLNEIDVYLWWRCCPLYWPNGMGSSPHTLEWIDKPAHTVLSCGKNGLWLCIHSVHQHISKARSV